MRLGGPYRHNGRSTSHHNDNKLCPPPPEVLFRRTLCILNRACLSYHEFAQPRRFGVPHPQMQKAYLGKHGYSPMQHPVHFNTSGVCSTWNTYATDNVAIQWSALACSPNLRFGFA